MSPSAKKVGIGACLAVMILASGLLLYNLGNEPLQNYDEAEYAQIARESDADHTWVTATYFGGPYLNKPPLALWAMEASMAAISSPEIGVRLPSALAGIALVAVVILLVLEVSGDYLIAALGGAVLATNGAFVEVARQARVDTILCLCITLSAYFFVRALRDPRWFLGSGVALGCAIMTKDVVAIFAVIFAFSLAGLSNRWGWFKNRYFWGGVMLCALAALPWHLYETARFGWAFWQNYIGENVVVRTAQDLFVIEPTNAGYIRYLLSSAFPWTDVFVASTLAMFGWCLARKDFRRQSVVWASTATVVSVLAVFFIAKTKAFSYLLPLYPFLAIAIALGFWKWYSASPRAFRVALVIGILVLAGYGMSEATYNGWHRDPYYASQIELAREEKSVAEFIPASGENTLYAFSGVDLGSILFYSGREQSAPLTPADAPRIGDLILLNAAARSELAVAHPALQTKPLYAGADIELLDVVSDR